MRLLESIITFLTPDNCIICGNEGDLLCEACVISEIIAPSPTCYHCGAYSVGSSTCLKCRKTSPLEAVWVSAPYEGYSKQLVAELKFSSRRGASKSMALACLPLFPRHDFLVTHLPTSPNRIRERGFDQAALLARAIASARKLHYSPLLLRVKNVHQVGATKAQRERQMKGAFRAKSSYLLKDRDILLVDDVMTTGASMEEAAKVLKRAGARKVYGVVYAR